MTQHSSATIERVIPDHVGLVAQCECSHTYLAATNVLLVEHRDGCSTRYAALGYTIMPDAHRDARPDADALEDDTLFAEGFTLDDRTFAPPVLTGILTDEGRALAAKGLAADAAVDAELPPPRNPVTELLARALAGDPDARVQLDEQLASVRAELHAAPANRPRGHADRLAECVSRLNDAILDASLDGLHVECAYTQSDLITGQVTLIDVVRVSRSVASHGSLAGGALARHRGR